MHAFFHSKHCAALHTSSTLVVHLAQDKGGPSKGGFLNIQ